jgi:uncharacterized membrane protein (UPF0127 family)
MLAQITRFFQRSRSNRTLPADASRRDADAPQHDVTPPTPPDDHDLDTVRSINVTKGTVVAERVVWATGAAKRRGLLGRDSLAASEGMYLVPCQWIHMFGMRFPIDVAFLSSEGRVLAVHHALRPNRLSRPVLRADGVLELAAGVLRATNTRVGDMIELVDP